jgi:hypothetical protein
MYDSETKMTATKTEAIQKKKRTNSETQKRTRFRNQKVRFNMYDSETKIRFRNQHLAATPSDHYVAF